MQFKCVKKDYFVYIEKNEKVIDTLTQFCMDQGITNANISGIGVVKNPKLALLIPSRKRISVNPFLKFGNWLIL